MRVRRLLPIVLAACALSACGGSKSVETTTSTQTTPGPRTTLTVFRVAGGRLRAESVSVPHTQAVAAAVLHALGVEATVTIAAGTATVDLATATQEREAEIVCSLTRFPTVQRVDVGGRTGLTCDDFEPLLPLIFLTDPATGATVPTSFTVSGSASVFEATFQVQLRQGGKVVDRQTVTASEGAPGRGSFTTTLAGAPGPATVHAFAASAADGSPQHVVDVPIRLKP